MLRQARFSSNLLLKKQYLWFEKQGKLMPYLSVFSTNGSGFGVWGEIGSLHRELAIYKRFAKEGWNVSFYTYDRISKLPDIGFAAEVYPQWPYILPKRLDWLYQAIMPILRFGSGKRSSIIITNQAHGGWPAIIAGRLWGAKVIARCGMVYGESAQTLHKTSSRTKRKTKIEKWTFKHADKCVVPTKELANWVSRNYKIDHSKIAVIPNYVDTEQFILQNVKEKDFDIICIGRLVPKKRYQLLLESLSESKLKIHIIGAGKLSKKLSDIANKNSIDLTITQRVEHKLLPSYINRSSIYVNVGKREGHPKALIEAMACGCPCICTNSVGLKNLILDGKTGLLIAANHREIRNTISRLLQNESLRKYLGKNARDYAAKHFSLNKVFKQYERLFEEVLIG
jgi:glycosyltransferase involved in cell wall biosynthesis